MLSLAWHARPDHETAAMAAVTNLHMIHKQYMKQKKDKLGNRFILLLQSMKLIIF